MNTYQDKLEIVKKYVLDIKHVRFISASTRPLLKHCLERLQELVDKETPKYKTIELIESREIFPFGMPIGLFKFEKVKKDYGDRKITSVMDFNDTHTTSIIIEKKR